MLPFRRLRSSRSARRPLPLRRRLLALGAAALTVLGVAAAAPFTASASAAPLAGVQSHLLWSSVDSAEMDRQLNLASSAHANLMRVDLGWSSLEQSAKGQYDSWYLGKIDTLVSKAQARGIHLLFTVTTTPCWASSAPDTVKQGCSGAWWSRGVQNYAPANPRDYADALAFLVRRYGSKVRAWELWNEPNSSDFFNASDPAGQYAALVKAAYPAAKAADANSTILAGSLMHADYNFTSSLYQHGIKGYFDAFSIHPYSDDRSPLDAGSDQWINVSFLRGVPAVHDTMVSNGDAKALWLTEFGWNTSTVRGAASWQNGVDESTQATNLQQAFEQMRTWSYVDAGVCYELVDMGSNTSSPIDNFGLVHNNGSLKPSYNALRTEADAITSGATPNPQSSGGTTTTSGGGTPTGTTGGTTTSGGGTTAPPKPKKRPTAAAARVTLRANRSGRRLRFRGAAPTGRSVDVRVFAGRKGRFGKRPAYRIRLHVGASGRFAAQVATHSSTSGGLLVTAQVAGTTSTAAARVA